eukprot:scaffold10210_cov53-Phaeocystis_antarctica.AAC.9
MPLKPEKKFVVGCGCSCSCTPHRSPSAPACPVATPAPSVVDRMLTIAGLALSCALCDACAACASALASNASAADCRSLAAGPVSPRCAALAASASAVASAAAAAARAAPSARGTALPPRADTVAPPRADTVAAICVAGEAWLLAGAARLLRLLTAVSCGLVTRRAMRGAAAGTPLSAAPLCRRPTALRLSGAQAGEASEERFDCTAPPAPPRWLTARCCTPLGCGATRCIVPIGAVARRCR